MCYSHRRESTQSCDKESVAALHGDKLIQVETAETGSVSKHLCLPTNLLVLNMSSR